MSKGHAILVWRDIKPPWSVEDAQEVGLATFLLQSPRLFDHFMLQGHAFVRLATGLWQGRIPHIVAAFEWLAPTSRGGQLYEIHLWASLYFKYHATEAERAFVLQGFRPGDSILATASLPGVASLALRYGFKPVSLDVYRLDF